MLKILTAAWLAVVVTRTLAQELNQVDPVDVMEISCQRCDALKPCPEGYDCNSAGLCQVRECRRDQHCADGEECLRIPCCEVEPAPDHLLSKICRAIGVPLCDIQCLVYDPVCARDGVTYGCGQMDAECHATCVEYEGECRVDDEFQERVCTKCKKKPGFVDGDYVCERLAKGKKVWTHRECETYDDCEGDDVCEKKGCCDPKMVDHWQATEPNSICVPNQQWVNLCPRCYEPVCTFADNDYGNECLAEFSGECVAYEGVCVTTTRSQ